MPRFFFNIYDGGRNEDQEGTELADESMARQEAVRFVGDLLADESMRQALKPQWSLDVTDEAGDTVFRLDVSS